MAKLEFNSYSREIDGQEYCSVVETYASNVIEEKEDAGIVYPSNGKWGTVRSETYRITSESSYIMLPLPIYKIISLKIKPIGMVIGYNYYDEYKNEAGESFIPDITDFIVLEEEWKALPPLPTDDFVREGAGRTKAQSNTFTYNIGDSSIWLSANPIKSTFAKNLPTYATVLYSAFLSEETKNYSVYGGETLFYAVTENGIAPGEFDVKTWEFQIEYIPIQSETKLRAHKSDKTTREYTQIVNQRAETISTGPFGKYLYTTAQKTGTPEIKVAKQYKRLADVLALGTELEKDGEIYKLVANSWRVTNPFTFTVIHTFSKSWTNKSKHVAVDQKYRNWDIPFDDYIWRTIYYEEFIELSGSYHEQPDSAFANDLCVEALRMSLRNGETNIALNHMWFENDDTGTAVVLNCSTMSIGNSIVFSAAMKDNMSAGLRVSSDNSEYCEDVIYCNSDGTLEVGAIHLSSGIENYNSNSLPYSNIADWNENTPVGYIVNDSPKEYFYQTFYIDKDPAEAIKVTIQVHFVPLDDWIVVGSEWAKSFPLIVNKRRTFRLYGLKKKIREGVDVLDAETLSGNIVPLVASLTYTCDGYGVEITNNDFKNRLISNGCAAWAITDFDNRLFVGSNDVTKTKIYFSWKRKI